MPRWLEYFTAAVVILLAIGLLVACWMPAYVGVAGDPPPRHERSNATYRPAGHIR